MKISRILSVAKADNRVRIVTDGYGEQWICTNGGIYRLSGFPKIHNQTETLNFIGVPSDKHEAWSDLDCCGWAEVEIEEAKRGGEEITYIPLVIKSLGKEYAIIGNRYFLPLEFLKPIGDCDKIEITPSQNFARIYNGVELLAILLLVIPSETTLANIAKIGYQCKNMIKNEDIEND